MRTRSIQAVNGLNAGGFLNAFMVFSAAAGLGVADFVGAANAFAAGVVGRERDSARAQHKLGGWFKWLCRNRRSVWAPNTLSMTLLNGIALGPGGQNAAMAGFIDGAIQRGAQIIFTSDPSLAAAAGNAGTAFEYSYLTQTLGYQIVQEGTSWVAVAP